MEEDLQARIDGQIVLLERVSSMTQEEAKKELMDVVEKKITNEVATYIHEQEEEAKSRAQDMARAQCTPKIWDSK